MNTDYEVIIIGSGFSGLCAAIKLQEKNFTNFIILERDADLGGTWWKNTYPGAAVDVESRLYSFSFFPYNWTRTFAKQSEILDYTNTIIDHYKLREKAQCNVNIESLTYNKETKNWTITFADGKQVTSKFIINATGGLSQESIPNINGLPNYKGRYFHTSKWEHDFDYTNKNIAVIGTGASAIQVVPAIAEKAKNVYVLQRTPHWIMPRPDRPLSPFEQKMYSIPFFNKLFRGLSYAKHESRVFFFSKFPKLAKVVKLIALKHLKKQVQDEKLRSTLTPNFDIGCKRILLSNDYYPALQKSNVHLEISPIEEIQETGIKLKDKTLENIDLLVFATGFHASENAIPYEITGKNKVSINDYWKEYAHAYYGISVPHFPNLFMAMGPNTGTGHTSVIYFIESQMNYIIDALCKAKKYNWQSIEIKEEIENDFNIKLQKQLKKSIWQVGGCKSWYLTKSGKNTTMYPDFSFVYRWKTRKFEEGG
ncbi:MAG: NAD(P)/FAD-dependent oxidoreductase, partial [Chitinophagales bacterium]|nr:NAD(P)/FAD-dependent oxidoreductase [Chitinophagales bacterium]